MEFVGYFRPKILGILYGFFVHLFVKIKRLNMGLFKYMIGRLIHARHRDYRRVSYRARISTRSYNRNDLLADTEFRLNRVTRRNRAPTSSSARSSWWREGGREGRRSDRMTHEWSAHALTKNPLTLTMIP